MTSSFVLVVAQLTLATQAGQASIAGTIRDAERGAALPGVVITLPDLERWAISDDSGRYVLHDVAPGPQHLVLRLIGYQARTLHALVPRAGLLEINLSLRAEPIPLGTIAVRPPVPVRGQETSAGHGSPSPLDRGLTLAALRNHPQLAEPDPFLAMAGGEIVLQPETPTGIHIRGGAADQTAYTIDGIPVFSPYHAGGLFSAWNPDALARLDLASTSPSPALPDALSGVLAATTRTPGRRYSAQSSLTTTHARFTVDGPLGPGGAGVLVSLRSGFPGGIGVQGEPTYLRGETGDLLARLETPLLGGRFRVLRYESESEIDAARAVPIDAAPDATPDRNRFDWRSESTGITWTRVATGATLGITGWSAKSGSGADWALPAGAARLASERQDAGLLATITWRGPASGTLAGVRFVRSRTRYGVTGEAEAIGIDQRTPAASALIEHDRLVGPTRVQLGASLTRAARVTHLSPRASLQWSPATALTVSAAAARLYQYSQSLRNPESVVGTIFPADLAVGAGDRVPVARSDQVVGGADYRPFAGLRLTGQAWVRRMTGLVHVAPRDGEPFAFATDSAIGFVSGSARARGLAMEASMTGARYAALASWGWQRVRYAWADSSWTPDHAARHSLEAGIIVFPGATWSLRAGGTAVLGRRTTALAVPFEFESCNLLDAGCEFSGSPHYGGARLGGTQLPSYYRIDLGARKHWDIALAGRHTLLSLFGTITNVLARTNVLTWAIDADTGERTAIELRPVSPLVVGIDWRF